MGKDKKKKKKQEERLSELENEYTKLIELLKAKHEQLDGILREARAYLSEAKDMRDEVANRLETQKREASLDK